MNDKLYMESIILIGPSGAGKSTIAEELSRKLNMPRLCLDRIANRARKTGFTPKFKNVDEFNCFMISEVIKRAKQDNIPGVVDFGAGHSVYDDNEIFEKVISQLKPFKNIVLLLPSIDETLSLNIMANRSTGDKRDNLKFLRSSCNRELATMTIYGNGRTPSDIANEIILRIKEREETSDKQEVDNESQQDLPPQASNLDSIGDSDYHRRYIDTLYWAQKITKEDKAILGLSEINGVTAEIRGDLMQTQQQLDTK